MTVEKGLVNSEVQKYCKFKSNELDVFKNDLRELFAIRCRIRMTPMGCWQHILRVSKKW